MLKYREENGRIYHAMGAGGMFPEFRSRSTYRCASEYVLPTDEVSTLLDNSVHGTS